MLECAGVLIATEISPISTPLVGCPGPFSLQSLNPTIEQYMSIVHVYGGLSERKYPTGILIKLAFELLLRSHYLRSIFYEILYGFMTVSTQLL